MSGKRTVTRGKRGKRRSLRGRYTARLSDAAGPEGSARDFRAGSGFFFQLVASLADYAVLTMDSDGTVSSWNPGAEHVFGFTEEDIIGKPYSLLFSKEEQAVGAPRRELETALKLGRGIDETWHVRKDGSRFWAAGVVFPLKDQHGNLRGFTKIAQDLTKGKILEQAAEFTARVLSTVASSIPALVWYIDSNERVMFQNKPRLAWWRKEPTDVQDAPLSEAVDEDAYRIIRPFIRQALAGQQKIFEVELPVDGTRRWIHVDSVPDLDPEGKARGIVCLVTDISDTRTVESELREGAFNKHRLAAIVSTSADAIVTKDFDGIVRTWNPGAERIFGYRAAEIVGKPMTTIIPLDRLNEEREILHRLDEGKPYERFDTIRVTKDKREVHVSITVWPIRDREGRVIEAAAILRDITERKESERRLQEKVSERTEELRGTVDELERYTYTVAHDLRAPLRNIHHYVDRLRRGCADLSPEAVQQNLDKIATGVRRMDRLIADLLDYSRISSAKISEQPQDLGAIVAEVLKPLEGEISERRAVVSVEPSIPRVLGDVFLLTQALSNLLANALKFVPADRTPAVKIGAERKGDRVMLWVQDNGIGLDPKYRDKVFGLFERLHPQESYAGTGVGLAIVSRAAQRMGGTVGYESQPGQGSRFWLELKAAHRA